MNQERNYWGIKDFGDQKGTCSNYKNHNTNEELGKRVIRQRWRNLQESKTKPQRGGK